MGRLKLTLPEVLSRNSQKHTARATQRSSSSGFLPMTCRRHWDFLKWWTLNVRKLHLTFKTKTPAFSDFSVGGFLMDSPCSLFFWEGCRIIYLFIFICDFFFDMCFVFYIQGPPNIFHLSGKDRCKLLFARQYLHVANCGFQQKKPGGKKSWWTAGELANLSENTDV